MTKRELAIDKKLVKLIYDEFEKVTKKESRILHTEIIALLQARDLLEARILHAETMRQYAENAQAVPAPESQP